MLHFRLMFLFVLFSQLHADVTPFQWEWSTDANIGPQRNTLSCKRSNYDTYGIASANSALSELLGTSDYDSLADAHAAVQRLRADMASPVKADKSDDVDQAMAVAVVALVVAVVALLIQIAQCCNFCSKASDMPCTSENGGSMKRHSLTDRP